MRIILSFLLTTMVLGFASSAVAVDVYGERCVSELSRFYNGYKRSYNGRTKQIVVTKDDGSIVAVYGPRGSAFLNNQGLFVCSKRKQMSGRAVQEKTTFTELDELANKTFSRSLEDASKKDINKIRKIANICRTSKNRLLHRPAKKFIERLRKFQREKNSKARSTNSSSSGVIL